MNFWNNLFSKTPTAQDLKVQLKEIDREQKKKRRDLEMSERDKQEKIREAVSAKKSGKQELLRDLFREMRQLEINNGYVNTDLRRLSLSKTALNSFQRKLEMLEQKKDRKSLQNVIVRFRESSIQKAIDAAEVDDETFQDMLDEILGEEEIDVTQGKVKEDVGFAQFDKAIGEMAKAEDSGSEDEDIDRYQEEINRAIKSEKIQDE
jgi:hypothetical protein